MRGEGASDIEKRYVVFETGIGCAVGIACAAVLAAAAVLVVVYVPFPTWAQALVVLAPGCAIMLPAFLVDWKAAARAAHRKHEAESAPEAPAAGGAEKTRGNRNGS